MTIRTQRLSIFISVLLLVSPASLVAAEPTPGATRVASPTVVQNAEPKSSSPPMQAMLLSCNVGTLVKTFGKADWRVTVCNDSTLMFSPAPSNGASHPFTYRFGELESPNIDERFRDKRARAAYLEVKALTAKQFDALVQEIRASKKD